MSVDFSGRMLEVGPTSGGLLSPPRHTALDNAGVSVFMYRSSFPINDIKKRGFVLLSVPRIEALALPIMIEQTTSESTPI